MTKEDVYKIEHDLIYDGTTSVFDIGDDKDAMLYLARIEGIMEMAEKIVEAMEELDKMGEEGRCE